MCYWVLLCVSVCHSRGSQEAGLGLAGPVYWVRKEAVPTWDPRWLQVTTLQSSDQVTTVTTLPSDADCQHEQGGGRRRQGRRSPGEPPGPVCRPLQTGEDSGERTNRLVAGWRSWKHHHCITGPDAAPAAQEREGRLQALCLSVDCLSIDQSVGWSVRSGLRPVRSYWTIITTPLLDIIIDCILIVLARLDLSSH